MHNDDRFSEANAPPLAEILEDEEELQQEINHAQQQDLVSLKFTVVQDNATKTVAIPRTFTFSQVSSLLFSDYISRGHRITYISSGRRLDHEKSIQFYTFLENGSTILVNIRDSVTISNQQPSNTHTTNTSSHNQYNNTSNTPQHQALPRTWNSGLAGNGIFSQFPHPTNQPSQHSSPPQPQHHNSSQRPEPRSDSENSCCENICYSLVSPISLCVVAIRYFFYIIYLILAKIISILTCKRYHAQLSQQMITISGVTYATTAASIFIGALWSLYAYWGDFLFDQLSVYLLYLFTIGYLYFFIPEVQLIVSSITTALGLSRPSSNNNGHSFSNNNRGSDYDGNNASFGRGFVGNSHNSRGFGVGGINNVRRRF